MAEDYQGLASITPERKRRVMLLTTIFENASVEPKYGYASYLGEGQGYTWGFIGFCTGTFDGNMVVKRYCERHPGNCMERYCESLNRIDEVNRTQFDYAGNDDIVGLDGFVEAVAEAAQDPEFVAAQIDVHDINYWAPLVAKLEEIGAKIPLTVGFLYDTWIQHGESGTADLIAAASASESPPSAGGDEKAWFWALTNKRREVLMTAEGKGEVWRESVERVSIYEELGSETCNNWDLDGPIVISETQPAQGFWVQNSNYGEFTLE